MEGRQPVPQGVRRRLRLLQRHELQQAAGVDRRARRRHGALHADRAAGAVPGRPRDGLRLDPVEGIRRCAAEAGQARADRSGADRHRAVRAGAVPARFHHPLPRVRRPLGTEAEAGCAGVLDQQGPRGAACQAARQRVPGHGIPQSGRPAGDQGGSGAATDAAAGAEHRLSGVQQPEAAVHRQARAHRHQHGDRQAGDPAGGVSGRRPAGEEPDPADHVVVQRPDPGFPARPRPGEEAAGRGGIPQRVRDRHLGDAGAAAVQSRCAAHRRVDAVRSRQGRHQGQGGQLRMGRIPQARAERRAPDGGARLDRRQRRSRQLLRPARKLCRGASGWRQRIEVVQSGVRRADQQGGHADQPGRADEAVSSRRR